MRFSEVMQILETEQTRFFARAAWHGVQLGRRMALGVQWPREGSANTVPYLFIETTWPEGRVRGPWVPGHCDLLANDWFEVS